MKKVGEETQGWSRDWEQVTVGSSALNTKRDIHIPMPRTRELYGWRNKKNGDIQPQGGKSRNTVYEHDTALPLINSHLLWLPTQAAYKTKPENLPSERKDSWVCSTQGSYKLSRPAEGEQVTVFRDVGTGELVTHVPVGRVVFVLTCLHLAIIRMLQTKARSKAKQSWRLDVN